jgi:hypothetical protein
MGILFVRDRSGRDVERVSNNDAEHTAAVHRVAGTGAGWHG